MRFKRRPETTIIEAEKHEPSNPRIPPAAGVCDCRGSDRSHVHSANGYQTVREGDWIVRERTEAPLYYPIKAEEFVKLYEPAGGQE